MATDRQIEANRLNARKCTGPRTPEGKAMSSQNALKTGLDARSDVIRSEKRENYEALIAEYYTRFNPATPEERGLVDTLVTSEWLSRRYMTIDAAVWEHGFLGAVSDSPGRVFVRYSETFARLDRRINSAQRNYQQALKQLLAIQSQRALEPAPEVPERDCEEAAAEPPAPVEVSSSDVAAESLNPKLVGIIYFTNPALRTWHFRIHTPVWEIGRSSGVFTARISLVEPSISRHGVMRYGDAQSTSSEAHPGLGTPLSVEDILEPHSLRVGQSANVGGATRRGC